MEGEEAAGQRPSADLLRRVESQGEERRQVGLVAGNIPEVLSDMTRNMDELTKELRKLVVAPPPEPIAAPPPEPTAAPLPQGDVPPGRVYLDLAWAAEGKLKVRRVRILLRNCPLGQQFLQLCTGPPGSSYANTNLLKKRGRKIYGGDYDGNGGNALREGLGRGTLSSGEAGTVCGVEVGKNLCAQFSINTAPGASSKYVFGMVEVGLDALQEVAALTDITQVTVQACGRVEWGSP